MRTIFSSVIITILYFVSPTLAQDSNAQLKEVKKLLIQVTEQLAEIKRTQNTKINLPSGFPSGAVVAFDLASQCPVGWSVFNEGVSRTIVGAYYDTGAGRVAVPTEDQKGRKLTGRHYRNWGGEENHILTEDSMPIHSHRYGSGTGRFATDANGGFALDSLDSNQPDREGSRITGTETKQAGKGGPHNNMPPYIALYYCKKD